MARKKKDTEEQQEQEAIEKREAQDAEDAVAGAEASHAQGENLTADALAEAHASDEEFDAAAGRYNVYNTVNEDHSHAEDTGDFVRESREEVVGSPVVSKGGPVIHDDVDAGPYGKVQSTVGEDGKVRRSERQEQAAKAVEAYENAKRERRGHA